MTAVARQTLDRNRKFKGLVRRLGIPRPHARGYLELLWDTAHECGETVFPSAEAVEDAAEWDGEAGALCKVLEAVGLLDLLEDGSFEIHDYWDHAPDYVQKRRVREMERQQRGRRLKDNGGQRRTTADNGGQRPPESANGPTPTPTPTPTPIIDTHTSTAEPVNSPVQYQAVADLWNEMFDGVLPKVKRITKGRKAAIRQRWVEYGGLDGLRALFEAVGQSAFLRGETGDRPWRADFDWVLKPANAAKIDEGKYLDKPRRNPLDTYSKGTEPPDDSPF